jgi:hypothetical protein
MCDFVYLFVTISLSRGLLYPTLLLLFAAFVLLLLLLSWTRLACRRVVDSGELRRILCSELGCVYGAESRFIVYELLLSRGRQGDDDDVGTLPVSRAENTKTLLPSVLLLISVGGPPPGESSCGVFIMTLGYDISAGAKVESAAAGGGGGGVGASEFGESRRAEMEVSGHVATNGVTTLGLCLVGVDSVND